MKLSVIRRNPPQAHYQQDHSVTYNTAKHLAANLAPLAGNSPHHVQNSVDFVNKVHGLKLEPNKTMAITYDVTLLFTCILPIEAMETVRQLLL